MFVIRFFQTLIVVVLLISSAWAAPSGPVVVSSPDGSLKTTIFVNGDGELSYKVDRKDQSVLQASTLGFQFRDVPTVGSNCEIVREQERKIRETWHPLWGENKTIVNNCNETTVFITHKNGAPDAAVTFRVFNDGLGFRTRIEPQDGFKDYELLAENTNFVFPADHTAWWIPDNWDTYESIYSQTPITKIGQVSHPLNPSHTHGAARGDAPHGCNTPVTLSTSNGLYLALHEANLTDYAGMTLVPREGASPTLKSQLVPWPDGVKVRGEAPFLTPWRTVQVADTPGGLIESSLILNLNEPNKLSQVENIRPMKLLGVWWSMHLGAETWGMEGGRHGATTENVKRYLDFAADNGFDGVLVEGWNTGWESWYKDDNFDFTTPYEDFDLPEITAYAKKRGVELVGHLETGGQIESFEKRLDATLDQYKKYGVTSVKTGYAGQIRPAGQYHHGQWMVRHYRKVLTEAAERGITLNAHEPIKDTGLRRTYPNMMTREGVRGMEWNAWSRGNPPEHTVNLAFTRMLAGPLDYTPGIFDITFANTGDEYRFWNKIDGLETKGRLHSTLARQLALFVVLYSPIQMASDLPENYEGHPAFQFLREVPVDWDESKVVNGKLGDYVTLARRQGNDWFIGSITDENAREFSLPLTFAKPGKYEVVIYADGKDADFQSNPTDYQISKIKVNTRQKKSLKVRLAPGGGAAIVMRKVD